MQKPFEVLKGLVIQNATTRTKQIELTVDDSATASTKTTLVASQTANRTIELPDVDTALIGDSTTDTLTNKTIDADDNTISNLDNSTIASDAAIDASKIADGSVSSTEFQYLSGATSDIQTQLDATASSAELDAHIADTTTHGTTGNIVGTSDAQALSNKTIDNTNTVTVKDTLFTIQDDGDATKQAQFSAGSITAGQTRAYTLPDVSTILVGTAASQTLTNKTIDADSNTISNIENADIKAAAAIDASKIADGSVSSAEFQYLAGVTSDIQDQLDSKTGVTGSFTDHHIIRADGTANIQNSGVTISDADAITGVTSLAVDSLLLDGTTITTTSGSNLYLTADNNNVTTDRPFLIQSPAGGQTGSIILREDLDNGPNTVTIVPASSLAANYTVTLPSATDTLVGKATTDTLTNKTLTTPAINGANLNYGTASDTNRLVLPSADSATLSGLTDTAGLLAYDTDLDAPVYNDGTGFTVLGEGGASGAKNYLGSVNGVNLNGDFELGTTSGWSLGNVTVTSGLPTGVPTFGSGAAGNCGIAAVTSGKLAGDYSLQFDQAITPTTAGNFIASDAFTIDTEDLAKVMTFKFYYSVASGANSISLPGTSSNSFGVAIYDVSSSAWIIPAGVFSMVQKTGAGIATGTFQTTSSSTQYRIVVYNANATSGICSVIYDDFYLGPQTAPIGPVVTDWQSFTPTGSWIANTTYTGKYRFVGDTAEIEWNLTLGGAPTATALTLNLPSGMTIDTSKLASGQFFGRHGYASAQSNSFSVPKNLVPFYNNTTSIAMGYISSVATSDISTVTATAPITWVSTNSLQARVSLPIVGRSSNVQMSNDTDTRVVALQLSGSSTVITSSTVTIAPTTVTKDTHGAFSGSTYTIPVSGFYQLNAVMGGGSVAQTAGHIVAVGYTVNGGGLSYLGLCRITASITASFFTAGSAVAYFNAGDTILFRGNADVTQAITSFSASIFRLSGPAVVAATESVNMRYTNSAATAIGTGAAVVPFATKVFDSHNAYATGTGLYTVPVSGKYLVSASIQTAAVNLATGEIAAIDVYKNGADYGRLGYAPGTGTSVLKIICGSDVVDCVAGDTIAVYAFSNVATTLIATAIRNHISIVRVGN